MKPRILFVDDEQVIITGLKLMLHNLQEQWDMEFVNSGTDALRVLAQQPFDIVISDLKMPEMDGAELLNKVMEKYPQITRVICSIYSEQEFAMRSAKAAHQFLAKPFDVIKLKTIVNRNYYIQNLLKDERLKRLIGGIKNLPTLPTLYTKIVEELQNPNSSIKRIGDLIAQDVIMTAEIIKVVNSAYFGLSHHISSPQQAASLLGINTIKELVLYVQLFSTFRVDPRLQEISLEMISKHSIMVGNLAKEIIHLELNDKKLEEDALIAGMLHDIGKLVLLKTPDQYCQVLTHSKINQCSLLESEYKILGSSHAEVGAYLLGLWGSSRSIVEAIAFHHCPSKLEEGEFSVLTAVHIANDLVQYVPNKVKPNVIDYAYLASLNLIPSIPKWVELSNSLKQKEL